MHTYSLFLSQIHTHAHKKLPLTRYPPRLSIKLFPLLLPVNPLPSHPPSILTLPPLLPLFPHTIGSQQEEGGARLLDPADLVDFFLNLQTLEVVELWLVALEGAIDIVVTSEDRRRRNRRFGCTLKGGEGNIYIY